MTKDQIRIAAGALLHDLGKVLYRSSDGRNHSESGYDFLKKRNRNGRHRDIKSNSISSWKEFKICFNTKEFVCLYYIYCR